MPSLPLAPLAPDVWAAHTFGPATLGDPRRTARLAAAAAGRPRGAQGDLSPAGQWRDRCPGHPRAPCRPHARWPLRASRCWCRTPPRWISPRTPPPMISGQSPPRVGRGCSCRRCSPPVPMPDSRWGCSRSHLYSTTTAAGYPVKCSRRSPPISLAIYAYAAASNPFPSWQIHRPPGVSPEGLLAPLPESWNWFVVPF